MPREEGWYFLQAGKFLERAEKTARALDVNYRLLVGDARDGRPARAADAATTRSRGPASCARCRRYESYYRVSSQRRPARAGVIELLLLSPVVPRSMRFAMAQVDAALAAHHGGGAGLQRLRALRAERRRRGAARRRAPARRARLPAVRRHRRQRAARAPRRPAAAVLPHRRADRVRVLRAPAADGAGGHGVRYRIRHAPPTSTSAPSSRASTRSGCSPWPARRRRCSTSTSSIEPPATVISFRDYYGNAVHDFGVPYLHEHLSIHATSDVVTHAGEDEQLAGPRDGEPDASPSLALAARGRRLRRPVGRVPRAERVHRARRRLGRPRA